MSRTVTNTVAVLVATAFTALAIAAGVGVTNAALGGSAGSVASYGVAGSGSLTCPRTGCTASSCHATQGGAAGFAGAGRTVRGEQEWD